MKITSYVQLQQYLTQILNANISSKTGNTEESDSENAAPHGAFWNTLSYNDFVTGDVPNIGVPILAKSNSGASNLILALRGQAPFDGSEFERMPMDGPPFLTDEQIAPIALGDPGVVGSRWFGGPVHHHGQAEEAGHGVPTGGGYFFSPSISTLRRWSARGNDRMTRKE